MEIKTGDIIEVLPGVGNSGVEDGEQGLVIDGSYQHTLRVIFPANPDPIWNEDDGDGWWVGSKEVKLVYRPRKLRG